MPQNVRNIFDETGEWALSSFDHRHQFIASGVVPAAVLRRRRRRGARRCSAAGASTPSSSRSRARRSRSTSASIAPTSAPGRRSGPISCAIPNLPGGERTPERWFDTSAFALPAPFTFGSAPRNSVIGPGYANVDFALAKTWALAGALAARVPLGNLQPASIARTSTCRTASSATRTSAASSARRTRARCSSACGWRSDRPSGAVGRAHGSTITPWTSPVPTPSPRRPSGCGPF